MYKSNKKHNPFPASCVALEDNAELFQNTKQNVSLHIQNILSERELQENPVIKEYLTTASDGKSYLTKYYNLDMILAIGYRVKSSRVIQFGKWASTTLKEYLVKGFALNDLRLKNPEGSEYFEELISRIHGIRSETVKFF
jgi:hypothetical protein